jgi:transposase
MKLQFPCAQEFRLRTIVELHRLGKGQKEIAQIVDCSQVWVSKVLRRYRECGLEGLLVKGKAKGARAKLDDQALQSLSSMLVKGALFYGFETDNWIRERIAELILNKFSVSYHPAHISGLMRKIGFSLQKPKTRSYRKDDLEVSKWKNEQLPQLKKSP